MKTTKYQKRFYRDWVKQRDLIKTRVSVQETDLEILTDKPVDKDFLIKRIRHYRKDIELYITRDQRFLTSLKPIPIEINAPPIVKEMAKQSKVCNVGPMAAVAGAIAGFLGRDLLKKGYKDVIIENGGDIFLKSTKSRNINVYSGRSKFSKRICIKIEPKDAPIGIATSSGTIGHSLSFGCADSVVILAKNATLADSVATAAGNLAGSIKDLPKAVNFARSIKGVLGVLIILKGNLAAWGKIKIN